MQPNSAKKKGRAFEEKVKRDIQLMFSLNDDEIKRNPASCPGCDIQTSKMAQMIFPFGIECKNRENLELWKTITQAETNAEKEKLIPIVVFKRNRSREYAIISWWFLLWLIQKASSPTELYPAEIKEYYNNAMPQKLR